MKPTLLLAALLIGMPLGAACALEEPGGSKPYLLSPPPSDLSPRDRDRALLYRQQLQRDVRRFEFEADKGTLDPLDRRTLLDRRSELDRMNRILTPPPTPGDVRDPVDGSRLLEPPRNPGANPILGR